MRITGGAARGRTIAGPEGLELRPTGSKVRQAFFNILQQKLNACSFLDVCAGTGLMGMEALSRGAAQLIAVEENRKIAKTIEGNLKRLGFANAEVICGDLRRVLPVLEPKSFDIIYADPPYKAELNEAILTLVEEHELLSEEGILVIEHLRSIHLPDEHKRLNRSSLRHYGQTSLSFYLL